ncbi:MAG: hypothetical protein QM796_20300 [Chthoniobacteraceae bacterium]
MHHGSPIPESLPEATWHSRRAAHEERVAQWIEPHLQRAAERRKHPVYDFLFEYYSFRPGWLRRWHPGLGVALEGESAREYLAYPGYVETDAGIAADPFFWKPERRVFAHWLVTLLRNTAARAGQYGCFGMHEWAMVYRAPAVRHPLWPLRLEPGQIAQVVEAQPPRCTHFDAFRFFTPEAAPLNRWQLTRPGMPDFEQPACLHANMDLYKWAYKLAPFTPSEWITDGFALAMEIRAVDMRASPYDFSTLGFAAIPIETPEGRADYEDHQREFARRAAPLRERLLALTERLVQCWE